MPIERKDTSVNWYDPPAGGAFRTRQALEQVYGLAVAEIRRLRAESREDMNLMAETIEAQRLGLATIGALNAQVAELQRQLEAARAEKYQYYRPPLEGDFTICKLDLRPGLPPVIKDEEGGVNCVLARYTGGIYAPTNRYIPRWSVVNTVYYQKNPHEFEGWIPLADQELPPNAWSTQAAGGPESGA